MFPSWESWNRKRSAGGDRERESPPLGSNAPSLPESLTPDGAGDRSRGSPSAAPNASPLPRNFKPGKEAREAILLGRAPEGLNTDRLTFEKEPGLTKLPTGLVADQILISKCPNFRGLPEKLSVGRMSIRDCPAFGFIPASTHACGLELGGQLGGVEFAAGAFLGDLNLDSYSGRLHVQEWLCCGLLWRSSPLEIFPPEIRARYLDLSGSRRLRRLPARMRLDYLRLRECTQLECLPEQLEARQVDVSGCVRLRWPDDGFMQIRHLDLSGCVQADYLPWWVEVGSVEIANSGLKGFGPDHGGCRLLWKGVEVDERIAFHPEQISVEEVFSTRNAELRRVLLERIGWERFLGEARPRVRHQDHDPGGQRRLLHVSFPDREDLLVLTLICPSTGRQYFFRVPPEVTTCHEAVAWMAGFDDAHQYEPVVET